MNYRLVPVSTTCVGKGWDDPSKTGWQRLTTEYPSGYVKWSVRDVTGMAPCRPPAPWVYKNLNRAYFYPLYEVSFGTLTTNEILKISVRYTAVAELVLDGETARYRNGVVEVKPDPLDPHWHPLHLDLVWGIRLPSKTSWVNPPELRWKHRSLANPVKETNDISAAYRFPSRSPWKATRTKASYTIRGRGSVPLALIQDEDPEGLEARVAFVPVTTPGLFARRFNSVLPNLTVKLYDAALTVVDTLVEVTERVSAGDSWTVYPDRQFWSHNYLVASDSYNIIGELSGYSENLTLGDRYLLWGDGGKMEYSDGLALSDSVEVSDFSGGGGGSEASPGESLAFSESYEVITSQNKVVTRTVPRLGCRTCGTAARVSENLAIFADGLSPLLEVNAEAGTSSEISGSPVLPSVAFSRGRAWAFGVQQTVRTGATVAAGDPRITVTGGSKDWIGRFVSVDGVKFDGACSSRIVDAGTDFIEVETPPDRGGSGLSYIVWEDSPAVLRWSDLNDHRSWPQASSLTVGTRDGTFPTGVFAVDDFLVLTTTGTAYRFDWGDDPAVDRALVTITDLRGCVGPRAATAVEGTLYVLGRQFPYFWATRGGRMFSLPLGDPIAPLIEPGGPLELDWDNSWCWFAWYSPRSNSVCWAVTRPGENRPRMALEYLRPSFEGSDEPGRWSIRLYAHELHAASVGHTPQGELGAYLAVSVPNEPDIVYLVADDGSSGDLSLSAMEGEVSSLEGGTITLSSELERVPGHGEYCIVLREDGTYSTFAVQSATLKEINPDRFVDAKKGDRLLVGWLPPVEFSTIHVSPDPPWARVRIEQIYAHLRSEDDSAVLLVEVESDSGDAVRRKWVGDARRGAWFFDEIAGVGSGVEGYSCTVRFTLIARNRETYLYFADIIRRKIYEPPLGSPGND